jgi:hypothetical protein
MTPIRRIENGESFGRNFDQLRLPSPAERGMAIKAVSKQVGDQKPTAE